MRAISLPATVRHKLEKTNMKKHFPLIILLLLFLSIGINESKCQKLSLLGKWNIIEVDSCFKVVYPGAKIQTSRMKEVTGFFTFRENGQGTIESNTKMLCGNTKFYWLQKSDTLIISADSITNRIVDYQKLISLNQNFIKIEYIYGCQRCCVGIWYNVLLRRKE
jgi:hypothetical protein